MDPAEAGDWLSNRPQQLVFLTGLDTANKPQHSALVNIFRNRTVDRPPLQLRIISGELDLPGKADKLSKSGILRREWPLKYLEKVPALIVLFVNLDWDHPSWQEKKTEAESKVASIRGSCRQGTRIALVMLQDRAAPTSSDDNLAAERAHELCQICSLTPKQLFVLPLLGDLAAYVSKLESAFLELAQGFYQQKLKAIRARSIPNNTPALVVRQMFKLAFLSELRQDTHTALRNYRLAYDQCKDFSEQWSNADVFELRSVVGLLNYKMCELSFLHSSALEAISQMRKHQSVFFAMQPGTYPTSQLASIELHLWKAKQCWYFAHLFEQAIGTGLSALATLNPGTHLEQAANIYSLANEEIQSVKTTTAAFGSYPHPDPLANPTDFFGQRPWRVGCDGLASPESEAAAVNAIVQRLVVNHAGVISLLSAAMTLFKKYGCMRMQKKVMCEMADVYYANGEVPKAMQLWSLVIRDLSLPQTLRRKILQKNAWAAFATASVKDYLWCCMQLMASREDPSAMRCEQALHEILTSRIPTPPFTKNDENEHQLSGYSQLWQQVLSERQFFSLQTTRVDLFLRVEATFLGSQESEVNSRVPVRLRVSSSGRSDLRLSNLVVNFAVHEQKVDEKTANGREATFAPLNIGELLIPAGSAAVKVRNVDLKGTRIGQIITINRVVVELGDRHSSMFGHIEFDEYSLNSFDLAKQSSEYSISTSDEIVGVDALKIVGLKSSVTLRSPVRVDCLIGEVASADLCLHSSSKGVLRAVRLEFKRNEQMHTEAAAVLFVDGGGTELKSELQLDVADEMKLGQEALVRVQFSAQLVGQFDLALEVSYDVDEESEHRKETGKVVISVDAKEPFIVKSGVMNMNGVPMIALLNHCEHVLKVDITSTADIAVESVEFLMADVVTFVDASNGGSGLNLQDELYKDDAISYCSVLTVSTPDEDVETPLGRLAIEWKRIGSLNAVRSVVPLCRVAVLPCPVSLSAQVFVSPATVRQPIDICFELRSHSAEAIELTASFELSEVFMFSGEKKTSLVLLPGSVRKLHVVVMALSAGRLAFPRINFRSPQVPDAVLQQALRTLPATIFVLPKSKERQASEA